MKLDVFKRCPVQNFAHMIEDQLGVIVRLRGRQINIEYSHPPVIYLPMLENGREDDVQVLYGFCLHEALHLSYTNPKVLKAIPDYVVKIIHNAIEDEFIERMGERDFPDARDHFELSYKAGYDLVVGKKPLLIPARNVCFLTDKKVIREEMLKLSLDPNDADYSMDLAKRLEIERVSPIWFYEQRGYTFSEAMNACVEAWKEHPWHDVFQKATEIRANNSAEAFEQAMQIYKTLGLSEFFSKDERPVTQCENAITDAEARQDAFSAAEDAYEAACEARDEEIKDAQMDSFEYGRLQETKDERRLSEKEKRHAEVALLKHRARRDRVKESIKRCNDRLIRRRKRLREQEKALKNLRGNKEVPAEVLEEAVFTVDNLRNLIDIDENLLKVREGRLAELEVEDEHFLDASLNSKTAYLDKVDAEAKAQVAYDENNKKIKDEITKKHESTIGPLEKVMNDRKEELNNAEGAAREVINLITRQDAEVEAPFAPGALEIVITETFNHFKGEETSDEVGTKIDDAIFSGKAKKYAPFTREFDSVHVVEETADSIADFAEAMKENNKIIKRTTDALRKLYSPVKARIKPNCFEGRLDTRAAYKIGLALNAVAVDVSRVWRQIVTKRDPKVAVEILLDCSGSMNQNTEGENKQSYLDVARKAATALSAVMSNLSIPHEIVGHTTFTKGVKKLAIDTVQQDDGSTLITIEGEEAGIRRNDKTKHVGSFSRFVPFKGYVYKTFNDKRRPIAVFSKVAQEDNLDGEALLWAAKRLAARSEKTKILIVISDAKPDATFSNPAELERHLLTVAKQIESKEGDGLHLCALGMDEKIKNFFKNAEVLDSMENLPVRMMKIVENILVNKVRTLG